MNTVFNAAGELATDGLLMGFVTVAFFVFFLGVILMMFRPSARRIYAEAALLPLDAPDPYPSSSNRAE